MQARQLLTKKKKKKERKYCMLEVSLNSTVEAGMVTTCTALITSGQTHIGTLLFLAHVMQSEKENLLLIRCRQHGVRKSATEVS